MSETNDSGTKFSRQHESSTAHYDASAAYRAEHGPEARRRKAKERAETRAKRTPLEQLDLLDARGFHANRERERLEKLIDISTGEK
jgi:hypothetical protein